MTPRRVESRREQTEKRMFLVMGVRRPDWDPGVDRRKQDGWDEHAAFMDGAREQGVIVVGGPAGDGQETLILVDAADEEAVTAILGGSVERDVPPDATRSSRRTIWLDGRRAATRSRANRNAQQRRRERVADRDRERVGGVVRARRLVQAEDRLDHPLHLLLVGAAVAADRVLTGAGASTTQSRPADAAARAGPRAVRRRAMRASAPTYDSSRAPASGASSADPHRDPVGGRRSRSSGRSRGAALATTQGMLPGGDRARSG